jgi:hypothetical protein
MVKLPKSPDSKTISKPNNKWRGVIYFVIRDVKGKKTDNLYQINEWEKNLGE